MCSPFVYLFPVLIVYGLIHMFAQQYIGLFFMCLALVPFALIFIGKPKCQSGKCSFGDKDQ